MPSQPQTNSSVPRLNSTVVQPLLAHFDAQEAAMLALKSLLYDIGMESENAVERRKLLVRVDAATELLRRLEGDFNVLAEQLSDVTGVPPQELTIRQLAASIESSDPETAEALRRGRRRLLSLRQRVSRVAANSGWIVSERRRIGREIFQDASGLTDSDRYDASGKTAISPHSLRYGTRS